ncbi:MAG: hypothetical protein NVSMB57_11530 [Actinomycetota bacterium]
MNRNPGGAIPRWLSIANVAAILVTLAVVVPGQLRAAVTAAPYNLKIFARANGSKTAPWLSWADDGRTTTTTGYILQRSRTSDFSSGVVEIRIAKNTLDFIDETETFNTTFWYRVMALNGPNRSDPSNVTVAGNGSGTRPYAPYAPSDVRVARSDNNLRITWRNNATNETGLWVERSSDAGTTWEFRASLSLRSSSYLDTDPPEAAPLYRVWAFNSGGLSPSESVQYLDPYAQTPNNLPSVNTSIVVVPSNLTSLVPQPSTIVSLVPTNLSSIVPSNLTSVVPSVGNLVPSLSSVAMSAVAVATTSRVPTIGSLVPSIPNAGSIEASVISMVPSVNPTAIQSTILNTQPKIWIGIYNQFTTKTYTGVWLSPINCIGLSSNSPCKDPPAKDTANFHCVAVPEDQEPCYYLNTAPGPYPH